MTLDLCMLGADGAPSEQVGLGVDEHWELLQRATPAREYPLLQRLADYYEDASFVACEITGLRAELEKLDAKGIESTVDRLIGFLRKAAAAGVQVDVLAD